MSRALPSLPPIHARRSTTCESRKRPNCWARDLCGPSSRIDGSPSSPLHDSLPLALDDLEGLAVDQRVRYTLPSPKPRFCSPVCDLGALSSKNVDHHSSGPRRAARSARADASSGFSDQGDGREADPVAPAVAQRQTRRGRACPTDDLPAAVGPRRPLPRPERRCRCRHAWLGRSDRRRPRQRRQDAPRAHRRLSVRGLQLRRGPQHHGRMCLPDRYEREQTRTRPSG